VVEKRIGSAFSANDISRAQTNSGAGNPQYDAFDHIEDLAIWKRHNNNLRRLAVNNLKRVTVLQRSEK
jgi:hypothetical protein